MAILKLIKLKLSPKICKIIIIVANFQRADKNVYGRGTNGMHDYF